ncbi:MAG: hypothetical protein ACR2LQ_04250 [Acidimicrobiales bacterium]
MGLKDLRKRFTQSIGDMDNARLQSRYECLGLTAIGSVPLREPVRLVGEVAAMQVVPRAGSPSLEITISDGTGRCTGVFTGRRHIGGLDPGRGVLFEGVGRDEHGRVVLLNPAYTLLPHA